ncbi:methylaspartate ammonia-lyase [Kibdelosporangium philippinense]|uniref:methylaspartate ammonia-lyase n=1 Tax=Kibdelosporangium philippinense TaxID=211113 RepID=A0ABS8Z5B6_9PSEU|nr:methylaspartate ammonia-lyase [Kibdelosporangium philippinense]MCE7003096.1 methylaspartate ammonia-lyase [Kibdelosporangium philippinense]
MTTQIVKVVTAKGQAAFYADDQAAIRAGARRDGKTYLGQPVTPGFRAVRQPADALSVMLVLNDGQVAHGDCVGVQYAGVAGRETPFNADKARTFIEDVVAPAIIGRDVTSFRAGAEVLTSSPAAVAYGVSQALLDAAALATKRTAAEVIVDEYDTGVDLRPIPLMAQSGEDRHHAVDSMIIKEVDALPHGLINNATQLVGVDGQLLVDYVRWVSNRVKVKRANSDYQPVLHFDTYGTPGFVFDTTESLGWYLARLAEAASPFRLRVEQPLDAGNREKQVEQLAALRAELSRIGADVQIVADEWCNTVQDIKDFVAAGAADMIHVKVPDLGGLDQTVVALRYCAAQGVRGYCGGSCSETARSAQLSVHVAMACGADQVLVKPGMGADAGLSVVRTEMAKVLALKSTGP